MRKSAGLCLNLLHHMSDAGIEDLSHNPSADTIGVIMKVEDASSWRRQTSRQRYFSSV